MDLTTVDPLSPFSFFFLSALLDGGLGDLFHTDLLMVIA
jgi:hypothetical protein